MKKDNNNNDNDNNNNNKWKKLPSGHRQERKGLRNVCNAPLMGRVELMIGYRVIVQMKGGLVP